MTVFFPLTEVTLVICNLPDRNRNHLVNWSTRQAGRLGAVVRYKCEEGYSSPGGQALQATCTRDGWRPDPLCEGTQCDLPPKVENAVVGSPPQQKYITGSEVIYKCRDQYTLLGNSMITCNNGNWGQRNISCTSLLPHHKNVTGLGPFCVDSISLLQSLLKYAVENINYYREV
uniref:Sushi domain-containing protein n=1 Tax=Echeneis naucrates TaxID=173247 RepID=A0A665TF90_ECHNA